MEINLCMPGNKSEAHDVVWLLVWNGICRFALFPGTARNGMAYSVALFSGTEQIKLADFDFQFGNTDAGGHLKHFP